jgi:hypothetical protein
MRNYKSYSSFVLLIAAVLLLSSCARKMSFGISQQQPAAQGQVKLKKDDNKNTTVGVSVLNLAPAERLSPARNLYVVWMVTDDNQTKNIGQLKSSTGFLSKKLKASLNTITPFTPVRFFITAEDDGSIQYPGLPVILTTN